MPDIVIYSSRLCPYCTRAKHLLRSKGAKFTEIEVMGNAKARQEAISRSGQSTVPQIWVGDKHVGGCDDLYALERSGQLDKLLS